jgi:Fe-S-cluster containining protein
MGMSSPKSAPEMRDRIPCFRCGTCCIAPDISTLRKPVGVPCAHLRDDRLCGIYPDRPPVCRDYRPDDLCLALQALPPDERVPYYLAYYGMTDEAPAS